MAVELAGQLTEYLDKLNMLDNALMIAAVFTFGSLMFVLMGRKKSKTSKKKKHA